VPDFLFETHFDVRNLEQSTAIYRDVVSLEPTYVLSERPVAFFWTGGRRNTMIGLWLRTSSPNA
jgi:hypothetical protein